MRINNFNLSTSSNLPNFNKVFTHNDGKTSQDFILKPDVDTYRSSFLEASLLDKEELLYGSKEAQIESWEAAKQKYGDDSFKLYSGAQHLLFGQKLHEMGFFDGMSEEEVSQYESLLKDITEVMSSINMNMISNEKNGNNSFSYFYQGDMVRQKYDAAMIHTYSDDAKVDLESATAALHYFSEKYLDKEQKQEFDSMVNDFYDHNAKYLETYQDSQERMGNFTEKLYASGMADRFLNWGQFKENEEYSKHMGGVTHTKEEKADYIKNVANIFKQLQKTGVDTSDLWKQLKEDHLNHLTKGTERQDFKDRVWEQSEKVFKHMDSYWSKLLEN